MSNEKSKNRFFKNLENKNSFELIQMICERNLNSQLFFPYQVVYILYNLEDLHALRSYFGQAV